MNKYTVDTTGFSFSPLEFSNLNLVVSAKMITLFDMILNISTRNMKITSRGRVKEVRFLDFTLPGKMMTPVDDTMGI